MGQNSPVVFAGAVIVGIAALIYLATHTMPGYYNPPKEGDRSSEDLLRELFNKGRDARDSFKKALERGIPWVLPFDRTRPDDSEEGAKHITLGLNSIGVDVPILTDKIMTNPISLNNWLHLADPLGYFTKRINDTYLKNSSATAYSHLEWIPNGIATTDIPPFGFYQALAKIYAGDVTHIHFNLEGILQIPDITSYTQFANTGSFEMYNSQIKDEYMYHTAHEMFIIKHFGLCGITTFYDGYDGDTPRKSFEAKAEICGAT